ncbi:TRAP transporter substrate-binding protein [Maridesulfovibrio hydrothermalis]|uniref:Extracellular solute-binding protein, family 7 n=1 Tax=Maridesulfovibrio hydrothermalis AM13 = DSM 14728 TaxID=1121451 RepID=L0RE22_9BACT|nr:TRAP transporter substrate-binding protein [Maridesulfovibrio hydrothermalis]CCO24425.1 Extracellular solute-binding protein, family 7 [Maridesulfovibrio hydrothermalis AM13 = DSM 14728]
MKSSIKVLLFVTMLTLLASPAFAAKKVRWKLAMTWSSTLTPFASAPIKMAKMVEEMSGGDFTIRVEGSEKHKAALGILDMVKGGQYDIGHSASYYWKGKEMSTVFFCTVPFGMNADEQYAWFYYGGGMELMEETFAKFKVLSFPGGNSGVQMGGWFKKEINSLADLKGLKMRIPGLAGEVFAKLGVNVTNIAPGELYTSLDRGTIDALEWVGPAMDIKMGFHKIAPYYYTGWHEPATELQFIVNKRKYDRLPDNFKAILKAAMKASSMDMYIENFAGSVDAWSKMKSEYPNIKVKQFPLPVLKAMKKAADELYNSYAAKDANFKKVLESQRAYQKKAREWSTISEYNYIKMSNELKQ